MGRVLGIDLGTTNSCAAVIEDNKPQIIPIDGNKYTLSSVVGFLSDGRHLLGEAAKRQSVGNAENTVFAAKRLIGRDFDDTNTKEAMMAVPYLCVQGPHGDVRIAIHDKTFAIQEISAMLLAEIRAAAKRFYNEEIQDCVITVPAYFNDRQRQATKDAGTIAGLNVMRVINEPTAAAIAYGMHLGKERSIAVFDLGGGTFDVSVLNAGGGNVTVLASAGDAFLGGHDFDKRILDWLAEKIEKEHGVNLKGNHNANQRMREAAEAAKILLTDEPTAKITLPFLATKAGDVPLHVDYELTREVFEEMTADLINRSLDTFVETIRAAGLGPDQVDEVIMVGGMTCMPAIRRRVLQVVGTEPSAGVHPDLVVAAGAAAQAAMLMHQDLPVLLIDVVPHNLGIVSFTGMTTTVIAKNTKLPTEGKRLFTTVQHEQQAANIVLFQGDAKHVDKNEILGSIRLDHLEKAARGEVEIEVVFRISADGFVDVVATELATGQARGLRVDKPLGLDDDEMNRMAGDLSHSTSTVEAQRS